MTSSASLTNPKAIIIDPTCWHARLFRWVLTFWFETRELKDDDAKLTLRRYLIMLIIFTVPWILLQPMQWVTTYVKSSVAILVILVTLAYVLVSTKEPLAVIILTLLLLGCSGVLASCLLWVGMHAIRDWLSDLDKFLWPSRRILFR